MGRIRANLPMYHDPQQPLCLGCIGCPDLGLCGGLYQSHHVFNCMAYCRECTNPESCNYACRRNEKSLIMWSQEVRGFDLSNVERATPLPSPELPLVVPFIYHASKRAEPFEAEAVAIPLRLLFFHRTGEMRFRTREEVAHRFKFSDKAKLIVVGVDEDQPIENYWELRNASHILDGIAALKPDLVTAPNYSVFQDAPRWDNLHNMKRIAIGWQELVSHNMPAALHLNARTDRDWERWVEFIAERDEVTSIAFEFGTGAASPRRGRWHVEKLLKLAECAGREIHLIIRGGSHYLPSLRFAYARVTLIDTNAFVKTMKRKQLVWQPGRKVKWQHKQTPQNEPLDELLKHNTSLSARMMEYKTTY